MIPQTQILCEGKEFVWLDFLHAGVSPFRNLHLESLVDLEAQILLSVREILLGIDSNVLI